jgi:glycosyltransferase involved in cell wall biosynthesis
VALNDAAAFEQRLRELAADPARRNRMGTHNKEYVRQFYIRECAARYAAVFRRVIERSVHNACPAPC